MVWVAMFLGALVGGVVQTVAGFGAGVVLILISSRFFDMLQAPALNTFIGAALTVSLTWKYRRHIRWRLAAIPAIPYVLASSTTIRLAKNADMGVLGIVFGVFLVSLAVYFFLFDKKVSLRPTLPTAVGCALVSGVFAGLFGVGGPLMALYFVQVTHGREEYAGNTQFFFVIGNVVNTLTRIASGIYTLDLLPLTLLGMVGILLGMGVGNRIGGRLDAAVLKKVVYAFVGLSGVLQLAQELL